MASKKIETEERRAKVESLLLERRSVREISSDIGVPRSTVGRDAIAIREEWQRARVDAVNRASDEELRRLNALERAYWRLAVEPDAKTLDLNFQAFDRILRVMERRAKLLGLDAPKRIDIEARIRSWARDNELDEDEVLREAMRIVRERS